MCICSVVFNVPSKYSRPFRRRVFFQPTNCTGNDNLTKRAVADPGGVGGVAAPVVRVIFGSGDSVYKYISYADCLGTVSTFVACCYKHDICTSRIVTQNTLECAISKAKFHFFLGRGTALPDPIPS